MFITFALLTAAAALAPAFWFAWWLLADASASSRSRQATPVLKIARTARPSASAAEPYTRAA